MIIYDCEIIKAIPVEGKEKIEGIEYCEGWHDFKGMGISVICAYDYIKSKYFIFTEGDFKNFQKLVNDARLLIGFNSFAFDIPLCEAHGIHIPRDKSWDLQVEIWKAAGLSETFNRSTHGGLGLSACICVNFVGAINSSSNNIPVLWQKGQTDQVIKHCCDDVKAVKDLIWKIHNVGFVCDPRDSDNRLYISSPYLLAGDDNTNSCLKDDYDVILGCLGPIECDLLLEDKNQNHQNET